ncbi:KAT8 regulatory NSL complex subunit 3 isoform X3 [Halyomorpha halys]|uniref:KAT8 regulatory NSL complex subunit 3 isoform X3 n=1 Tax=Halyomorpha halys TaxID=286706 RepID=UPI0006D4DB4C|nr:KAT8 regulatory NSL complex subunit 3 isoform X3 [Halyomorpha halys]
MVLQRIIPKGKMDKTKNSDSEGDCEPKLSNYLQQLNGQPEFQNVVEMDHPYSRPWNWRPDNFYAKPAKTLFVSKNNNSWCSTENIDPVSDAPPPTPAYDQQKAQMMMDETTRLITLLRSDPGDIDWESKIDKSEWGLSQTRLFERVVRILHWERLNRLTFVSNWNEPVLRRISLDKSARRFRTTMASIAWKQKLVHWLHNLLLEVLEVNYLVAYIDILQTLKKKIPTLVERMISIPASNKINPDALKLLLKKPWDPASTGLTCYKPRRLPGNPLIVIVPPYGQNGSSSEQSSKVQRWLPYLSQIGNVIPVTTNNVASSKITAITSLEYMLSATRAKLSELKSDYVGRSVILFGLNSGSALACQVALVDQVAAVICMGFPLNTVEDKRGQPDDTLLNLSVPTLFVIGQHAATCYIDDIEEVREKLNVETGLVIVGAADDHLRITKAKQKMEGITQGMVDHCIIDEVTDFIGNVLSSPPQPPPPPAPVDNRPRLRLVEKKRKISIQDDIYPRKQLIPSASIRKDGITINITTVRRGGSRGRGRSKYITQSGNGGIAIARRGGLSDKGITRPSIENISVINSSNIDNSSLNNEGQTFKILPHIKVLGGEGFTSISSSQDNSSFVDELTPDRLLEMPIIIAADTQEEGHDNHLKVMMTGTEGLQQTEINHPTNKNEVKCATIYFRKRGSATPGSTRVSTINVGLAGNKQIMQRKPRLQNFPATKYISEK